MTSRIVGIALASIDILIGLIAISLQVSTYVLYGTNIADAASVGIWGGIFFIVTGILFFSRRAPGLMKVTAILSITAGLILIGLYSWRIRQIDDYTHQSHLREQIAGLVPNVLSDLFSGRGMSSLGDTFLGILGGGKRDQQPISQRQDKAAFAPNFSEGYQAFDHLSVYGKLSHDRCSSRIQVPVGSNGNTIGVLLFDYCDQVIFAALFIIEGILSVVVNSLLLCIDTK